MGMARYGPTATVVTCLELGLECLHAIPALMHSVMVYGAVYHVYHFTGTATTKVFCFFGFKLFLQQTSFP